MSEEVRVNFEIEYRDPKSLKPYWRNSKLHPRRQITSLANAIRRVGFDQPIVVDGEGVIIKGHGRQLASFELKMPLVPVVVRTDLSPMEVMAARIADNQAHTLSAVDPTKEALLIDKYVADGGAYGSEFFDFVTPGKTKAEKAKVATPQSKATVDVAGTMMLCPKCSHSFMEAKK